MVTCEVGESDGTASRGRGVLEGAFALLEAVEETGEAGLTALAARSGLPKTTAHRLLEQLTELGVVEHHGRCYRMGPRLFRLGTGWQPHPSLRVASNGPMQRLAGVTGATVGLCVLREGRTMAVLGVAGVVDHLAPIRAGATWPWHTAAGKLIVATGPPGMPLDPLPQSWRREASAIRENEMALDREEMIPGVCCVAAPVVTAGDGVVGALCAMADPSYDMRQLSRAVAQTARAVSAGLHGPLVIQGMQNHAALQQPPQR
ncbi:helix-turn-helix domain-containing protein [Streptomyces roseoverticillatus]|uniref:IclR family transcriptional regulator n=1 Tax=Streptomyces roseoverticillatus TaxID=66429 RepID=UPI001F1FA829|nr:helix-turn-helix domain-containing protein [Streptomyces roseoverticillatus]MCF3102239.1 helix-turn-helix domain-containing protein [Streptomyces roseoverticillatus]